MRRNPVSQVRAEAAVGIFSKRRKSVLSSRIPLLRWVGPSVTAAGLLYGLYLLVFGGMDLSALDGILETDPESSFRGETISLGDKSDRPADRIRIATFDVEQFADEKSRTRVNEAGVDVLGTIAKIFSTFDLVAVQEVQGTDGVALKRLLSLLNASGGQYAARMSDPIGEDHQESYAFVWDQNKIRLVPNSSYVVLDQGGRMEREPMVASFETVVPSESSEPPFRFTIINVHTEPSRVDPNQRGNEISVLADVFRRVRQYEYETRGEDDFIVLGNFNVGTENLEQLTSIPGVISLAADVQTDVGRTTTNDHILIDRYTTAEYAGRNGVLDFQADLGLTAEQAIHISDHVPLWAEFEMVEQTPKSPRPGTSTANSRTRTIQ